MDLATEMRELDQQFSVVPYPGYDFTALVVCPRPSPVHVALYSLVTQRL